MHAIHPHLPYDVIQSEVLPRLPAKSIGRFRCVCKAWNSFLSTPDFARMHLRYQTNYKLLLLDCRRSKTFPTLDCEPPNHDSITTRPIPFTDDEVLILASLDGLVCVALFNIQELPELAFWNPLTGAYKKFHTSVLNSISDAFAFYNDSSNDYKLRNIVSEGAFIYSRRLDSWRKINPSLETIYHISKFTWSHATFVAGKIYFLLGNKNVEGERRLISFDVESEKFKEIQFPQVPCGTCLGGSLVALNGCIHLCVAYKNISGSSLKFDMCKMDGDGWIKVPIYTRA
ncbi:putative F-box domain-containing protein [Helianthus anomalus]